LGHAIAADPNERGIHAQWWRWTSNVNRSAADEIAGMKDDAA
jgi:hypothetical protein